MRDVEARHIVALMEFMYAGEVNVAQAHLSAFLKTAESLKIRGLTDTSSLGDYKEPEHVRTPHSSFFLYRRFFLRIPYFWILNLPPPSVSSRTTSRSCTTSPRRRAPSLLVKTSPSSCQAILSRRRNDNARTSRKRLYYSRSARTRWTSTRLLSSRRSTWKVSPTWTATGTPYSPSWRFRTILATTTKTIRCTRIWGTAKSRNWPVI